LSSFLRAVLRSDFGQFWADFGQFWKYFGQFWKDFGQFWKDFGQIFEISKRKAQFSKLESFGCTEMIPVCPQTAD